MTAGGHRPPLQLCASGFHLSQTDSTEFPLPGVLGNYSFILELLDLLLRQPQNLLKHVVIVLSEARTRTAKLGRRLRQEKWRRQVFVAPEFGVIQLHPLLPVRQLRTRKKIGY